ncbi:hypothetical protein BDN72DRAFT_929761 [Pluteus cervinus]|uniref:Uncharacterized protein n=1 Tax=Pluteus cervinus TaxID=181527 RepID=A0ACD3BDJ6_9AGAR|nr:hypothetical protein BDN72DRAFT_929761 [Pluteus cervinus]
MKYVALLSGGKDSCFNLVHCSRNGHELIAAASLGPEPGKEELDSYLYQTVGQDAIEFVAQALEVPLYRRIIVGGAVSQGSEYGGRKAKESVGVHGDETEDLFDLLTLVKSHHPDVQGVSVGAILSNYQRVRVEHVCRRLGLTPLCYLWQRDQGELLSEMIEAGMEAVLIKVAGIGLTAKHLGSSLSEMQSTLIKLNQLYGSHICGEGGEYESLTLDCPLFKRRIILKDVETVIHSDNDFASVAYLRVKAAELIAKDSVADTLRVPPLFDDEFKNVEDAVNLSEAEHPNESGEVLVAQSTHFTQGVQCEKRGAWVSIGNIQRAQNSREVSIEEEVTECFSILQDNLAGYDLELHHCAILNIFLSSIDLFARMNSVYAQFFGVSPPARACVAVDLPPSVSVRLDCIAFTESREGDRKALHVQGLSYWAPANIGPYSQAISAQEWVFVSGQIGLIPSSLSLPSPPSLAKETALACQHVSRVIDAVRSNGGSTWNAYAQANIFWIAGSQDVVHVKQAHKTLPNPSIPTLFVVVKALPKDALVEKQSLFRSGKFDSVDAEEDELDNVEPTVEQGSLSCSDQSAVHWQISRFPGRTSACAVICARGNGMSPDLLTQEWDRLKAECALQSIWTQALSLRLFFKPSCFGEGAAEHRPPQRVLTSMISDNPLAALALPAAASTPIPCRQISTLDADGWDLALCILTT